MSRGDAVEHKDMVRRVAGGAVLVGGLTLLWYVVFSRLRFIDHWPAQASFAFVVGSLLAIGFAGGYLTNSWRAIIVAPVAVFLSIALVLALPLLADWLASGRTRFGQRGEPGYGMLATSMGVVYGGVAGVGAVLGVLAPGVMRKFRPGL
jgi:hypothetical protein